MKYIKHLSEWIKESFTFIVTITFFVVYMIPAIIAYDTMYYLLLVLVLWLFMIFGVPYINHNKNLTYDCK